MRKKSVYLRFFTPFSGFAQNGKQFGCGHTPKFSQAAGPWKCLLGSSPNPLDFGTNCPKVPALCACCLRPVATAPGPYFPARPLRRADDQYSPWPPRPCFTAKPDSSMSLRNAGKSAGCFCRAATMASRTRCFAEGGFSLLCQVVAGNFLLLFLRFYQVFQRFCF